MPDSGGTWMQYLWAALASFAGALTALSARPFKDMTRGEIVVALLVGAGFAMFCGPLVGALMFRGAVPDLRIMYGILYLMASGSNILIPMCVRKLGDIFGARVSQEQDK